MALTALVITAVMGAIIFVLWIGANLVHDGQMTGGQLASFVLYAALVAGGVGTMAEVWGDVMRAAGAAERLLELLHATPAILEPATPQVLRQPSMAAIRFDQVSFHYPSRPLTAALQTLPPGPEHAEDAYNPRSVGRRLIEVLRRSPSDIFTANIERVKESIRVLEEFFKLIDMKLSIKLLRLRFKTYDIEKKAVKRLASLRNSR